MLLITQHIGETLTQQIQQTPHDRLFVLCDEVTARLCWPLVSHLAPLHDITPIDIPPTDQAKNLQTLTTVWTALGQGGATRHSLLVNLGGGMVTDLGGFAASTFKRGITYINVPTTLLAMVDASVGGKTGINFGGLKNEIGVFSQPQAVLLDTRFLRTLDTENLLSGYAEMLKHGLISHTASHLSQLLDFDIQQPDYPLLSQLVATSVAVKQHVVEQDPHEQGLRKVLNLGHTIGHALESLALTRKPLLHGYAVAWGLVCELYLACAKCKFPTHYLRTLAHFVATHYGQPPYTCDDYPQLLQLMTHDKKNTAGTINFTLLSDVGQPLLDQTATPSEICEALDFLRDGL